MSAIILLGSSGRKGNTESLSRAVANRIGCKILDLNDYSISFFDYEHLNSNDDFLRVVNQLICHNHIIFASPVYWYSMSAQMKVFFDRLTDLLTIEKDLGRNLKGKCCSVIATGTDELAPISFVEPFKLTANYFSMEFRDFLYLSSEDQDSGDAETSKINAFISNVT